MLRAGAHFENLDSSDEVELAGSVSGRGEQNVVTLPPDFVRARDGLYSGPLLEF